MNKTSSELDLEDRDPNTLSHHLQVFYYEHPIILNILLQYYYHLIIDIR